jgi:ligand-binding sensor domain-containing protein/two-component sensor histidine kinase
MPLAICKQRSVSLIVLTVIALALVLANEARAEKLPLRTYTTADGLAHDRITRVVSDSRGFLWICTVDGLSRFDGYRFTNYSVEQGLPSPGVMDLFESPRGHYWVATQGGAALFNPVGAATGDQSAAQSRPRFTIFPITEDGVSIVVNCIYEDRAGQVWAGTRVGLFQLVENGGQRQFRRFSFGLPPEQERVLVWDFIEDREGNFWVVSQVGLVRRLPDGRLVRYEVSAYAVMSDQQGRLWLAQHGAFTVFKPLPAAAVSRQERFPWQQALSRGGLPSTPGEARRYGREDGVPNLAIRELLQTSDGRVRMVTEGGLVEFDGQAFRTYTTEHGLSLNNLVSLAEDRSGNLWVGTFSQGVLKLVSNGFLSYEKSDGLGGKRILKIFEDQAGALCAISEDWVINRFDGQRFTAIRPQLPREAAGGWRYVHEPLQDHSGEWWVLTTTALYRFAAPPDPAQPTQRSPKAAYRTLAGVPAQQMLYFLEDRRGDLWIATAPGLVRWERATETAQLYTLANGLPQLGAGPDFRYSVQAFFEDKTGNLWIGTTRGVIRYSAGQFSPLPGAELSDWGVRALHLDRAGRLWVTTARHGLICVEHPATPQQQIKTYTTAAGLASNTVRCIVEDDAGRIYVGAGRGVDRFDPQTGRFKHYTMADGLANSYVNAAYRDRHGRLWFGMLQGLSRLTPESDRSAQAPQALVNGLRVAGDIYPVSELGTAEVGGIEMTANRNQLQIDFFALGFGLGEALRYQYRLLPADSDWSAPTEQRMVNYPNLAPGAYRFLVRAVNAEGQVSAAPALVTFSILPPLWQRWWFVLLLALLMAAAVYYGHHYHVARAIELERVRTRIATDLHDDIGASLSQVAVITEVLRRQLEPVDPRITHNLSLIARVSREVVDSMSDIVWAINPQKDNLNDLARRMRRFAGETLAARDIQIHFHAPASEHYIKLGADVRRQVFLIFKETINNILRHADCTETGIALSLDRAWLVLAVSDNGKGISPDQTPDQKFDGHGLASMKQRAKKLGGNLEIHSPAGQGTTVTLKIPHRTRLR